jgi:hypothetical protein
VTDPTSALRRNNRIAAVLMLVATSLAGVAATGTAPALFVALVLATTATAFSFAVRGRTGPR